MEQLLLQGIFSKTIIQRVSTFFLMVNVMIFKHLQAKFILSFCELFTYCLYLMTVCINVKYLDQDYGLEVTLSVDGHVYINASISGKHSS